MLGRSYVQDVHKGIDPEAYYVRGLYLPKDEMIDLADLYESDDISKALTDEKGEHIGCSRIGNKVRPKNRALLAIYPLSPNSKSEERQAGTYYLKPIKSSQI